MSSASLPQFLWGVFNWYENGFHWNCLPPPDLLEDKILTSSDPWLRVAAILARARGGDFSEFQRLWPHMEDVHHLDRCWVAWRIYGSTAPSSAVRPIEDALTGHHPVLRRFAAQSAEIMGLLKLVPALLEAWNRSETIGDRETIGFAISSLLERDTGPIAEQANVYHLEDRPLITRSPDTTALTLTRSRGMEEDEPADLLGLAVDVYHDISSRLGEDTSVLYGQPSDILEVARRLVGAMSDPHPLGLLDLRYRYESTTGMDCRRFFHASKPQRLLITDAVTTFLASSTAATFTPGRRYFFGHPVP